MGVVRFVQEAFRFGLDLRHARVCAVSRLLWQVGLVPWHCAHFIYAIVAIEKVQNR
jgi:hypothetical protein